ncbi:MAG TPA: NAD(P)-dependent oxidoreductase [Planctomycetota bacterium]|nr:NAD(P)-dependent oxidoreductase [Planctomycetota bacterium]
MSVVSSKNPLPAYLQGKAAAPLRVAVTGGSGRIGKHVISQLLARGHSVINLDRKEAARPEARLMYVDLRRRDIIQPIFETVDAVCHLAEIPNVNGPYSPDEVYAHNAQAGAVVLQTAADLKLKRFVYTSSCQAYGMWGDHRIAPQRLPMDETHPLLPQNAYGMAKMANERYAEMVSRNQGLSLAIFRFPWVLDFDIEADEEGLWMALARSKNPTEGMATYVHVTDAASAYVLAIENPRPGCEAYHFSADEIFSCLPLRERQAKHEPKHPPLPADWPNYKSPLITDKARQHFGWKPIWNAVEMYRKKFGREPHEKA